MPFKSSSEDSEEEIKRLRRKEHWSWEIFVGCMFIGLGIGMIVGYSGAGVLLGMGVGFVLASLIKIRKKIEIIVPRTLPGYLSILAGLIFIILGFYKLGIIRIVFLDLLIGLIFILFGIFIMIIGIKFIIEKGEKTS